MTITIIVALAAMAAGYLAGAGIQRIRGNLKVLERKVAVLSEKVDRLEKCAKSRNPYRTNDGLEDAMAIVHDAVWQAEMTLNYVRARMRQVDETLQVIRSEPDRYDPERPNRKGQIWEK